MTFIEAATRPNVVRRSLKIAAVVGTILVAINYGDRIFPFELSFADGVKMLMTYCVPYCVSTYSAASTILSAESSQR